MAFNSFEFILAFLPITVAVYWLLRRRQGAAHALLWLLLASVVFYAYASWRSLLVIVPSILLDYAIARAMARLPEQEARTRDLLFALGVLLNVLCLGYFKYANFFLEVVHDAVGTHAAAARIFLPLGISFIVFQKIAFLADVRSEEAGVLRLRDFLLFTLFFPRTVAGPIVHYREVMPQLSGETRGALSTHIAVGVLLFSIGLFKKTVLADSIAQFVPAAFDPPGDPAFADLPPTLLTAWIGVLAYTLQLYFDFSGYTDMALGAARMLGVRLPTNFNSPYKAGNIVEYWNRWHISLTRFLTSYIYTPIVLRLTRSRIERGRPVLRKKGTPFSAILALIAFPTLITMTVSGLWHGAGWQFIAWGVLHGVYLTVCQAWRILRPRFWRDERNYQRVMRPLARPLTFLCVVLALVLFRAPSVSGALSVYAGMAGVNGFLPHKAQLLGQAGLEIPWPIVAQIMPLSAVCWIAALLVVVMFLPNSLELLRRFDPALDFPTHEANARKPADMPPITLAEAGRPSLRTRLRVRWAALRNLAHTGLDLTPSAAALAALLGTLGIMAIYQGGGFIYGNF